MTQHKWAKEIKAWADGAEIEHRWIGDKDWQEVKNPIWTSCDLDFRIKAQPKEPQYLKVFKINNTNIKFIEDGGYIEHNSDYIEYIGKIKLEVDDD